MRIEKAGMKKGVKKIIGVLLIITGLLALLTPFTPGSWLALIGLELVGIRMLIERKLFLKGKRRQRLIHRLKKAKLNRFAQYLEKRSPKSENNKDCYN